MSTFLTKRTITDMAGTAPYLVRWSHHMTRVERVVRGVLQK